MAPPIQRKSPLPPPEEPQKGISAPKLPTPQSLPTKGAPIRGAREIRPEDRADHEIKTFVDRLATDSLTVSGKGNDRRLTYFPTSASWSFLSTDSSDSPPREYSLRAVQDEMDGELDATIQQTQHRLRPQVDECIARKAAATAGQETNPSLPLPPLIQRCKNGCTILSEQLKRMENLVSHLSELTDVDTWQTKMDQKIASTRTLLTKCSQQIEKLERP